MSDKLIPLRVVEFNRPTAIPGCKIPMSNVEAKSPRLVDGYPYVCPQPYYDTELGMINIEGRLYPMERVHFMERAKMALSKDPPPENMDRYTIGKRIAAVVQPGVYIKKS